MAKKSMKLALLASAVAFGMASATSAAEPELLGGASSYLNNQPCR